MIPKPFTQKTHYNDLFIPKEHIEKSRELNMELWNQLMRINSTYPKEEIIIEHTLKDFGTDRYSFDMKLSCKNTEVQQHLDEAYKRHIYLPQFEKPENFERLLD